MHSFGSSFRDHLSTEDGPWRGCVDPPHEGPTAVCQESGLLMGRFEQVRGPKQGCWWE